LPDLAGSRSEQRVSHSPPTSSAMGRGEVFARASEWDNPQESYSWSVASHEGSGSEKEERMHEVYTIFHNKAIFVKTVNRFNAELFRVRFMFLRRLLAEEGWWGWAKKW
jgi:hypothetical protein